ncbi:MAG: 3-keto-5-aminohexanoate cleavage protein [Actinobacteria bacterium]|nr:3-keto-5-aminohexanoate cleavage protein [Actinomycetota bacterium]
MSSVSQEPLSLVEAADRELREYKFAGDLRVQPKWDIPEKVAIQVALAGRFSKEQETQHPLALSSFVDSAAEVIAAGASGVHVDYSFLVDEEGKKMDREYRPVESYKAVLDPLRERFGDGFVANLNVLNGDTFDECMEPARAGMCEVAPCASGHPPEFVVPAIEALQEAGVKPEIVIHSSGEIELAKRRLIDTGILAKPYYFILLYGLPFDSGRTLLSGTWSRNTQDMAAQLFLMADQLKSLDEGAQITVCAAGRASLYVTTLATMMGLHIRVGTEDTYWRSPLRDDVVDGNLEMFESARTIASLLGREVATANEYRASIGLPTR